MQLGDRLPLEPGYQFVDTTLGALIIWDGKNWRDVDGTEV